MLRVFVSFSESYYLSQTEVKDIDMLLEIQIQGSCQWLYYVPYLEMHESTGQRLIEQEQGISLDWIDGISFR